MGKVKDQLIPDEWDRAYELGRNDAARDIRATCRHAVLGTICTPCLRASQIAAGEKP